MDAATFDQMFRELNDKLDKIENQETFIDTIVEALSYSMGRLEWLSETMEKVREVQEKHKKK